MSRLLILRTAHPNPHELKQKFHRRWLIGHQALTQQVPELPRDLARLIGVTKEAKRALRTAKELGMDASEIDELAILIRELTLFIGFPT